MADTGNTPKPKPYRLGIELSSPDPEIILQFESEDAAQSHFKKCLEMGFVVHDRAQEPNAHRISFYPLTRVRAFRIYVPAPIESPLRPKK